MLRDTVGICTRWIESRIARLENGQIWLIRIAIEGLALVMIGETNFIQTVG